VNVNPNGEPGPGVSRDRNNLSPRIGFAWSPRGDTKQVIYGGTGMYYDQVILNIIGNARFTPPKVVSPIRCRRPRTTRSTSSVPSRYPHSPI
jgi:hypothetical protein